MPDPSDQAAAASTIPRSPTNTAHWRWVVLVLAGIVLFGGGAWWYLGGELEQRVSKPAAALPPMAAQEEVAPSTEDSRMENARAEVLKQGAIAFPDIIASETRPSTAPDDIFQLVEHEQNVVVMKIVYADRRVGHSIEFVYLGTTGDASQRFSYQLNKLGWNFLSGARNDDFGFVDMERASRRVRVSYTRINGTTTRILIQTIEPTP